MLGSRAATPPCATRNSDFKFTHTPFPSVSVLDLWELTGQPKQNYLFFWNFGNFPWDYNNFKHGLQFERLENLGSETERMRGKKNLNFQCRAFTRSRVLLLLLVAFCCCCCCIFAWCSAWDIETRRRRQSCCVRTWSWGPHTRYRIRRTGSPPLATPSGTRRKSPPCHRSWAPENRMKRADKHMHECKCRPTRYSTATSFSLCTAVIISAFCKLISLANIHKSSPAGRNSKSRSYNGTNQNLDLFHSLVHAVNNKFHAVLEFELIEGGHARIRNSDTGRLPWHTKMTVNTLLTTSFQRPA